MLKLIVIMRVRS